MSVKPARWLQAALNDIDRAVDWYIFEAGAPVADRFSDALFNTAQNIESFPALGTLRYADALRVPNLRHRAVPDFPYLIFYVEHEDRVDIWRLLHSGRDIPELLK